MTEEDNWTDEDGEPALRHWLSEEKDHPVFAEGSGEDQQNDETDEEESKTVVTNG